MICYIPCIYFKTRSTLFKYVCKTYQKTTSGITMYIRILLRRYLNFFLIKIQWYNFKILRIKAIFPWYLDINNNSPHQHLYFLLNTKNKSKWSKVVSMFQFHGGVTEIFRCFGMV